MTDTDGKLHIIGFGGELRKDSAFSLALAGAA
jgi:hypothetical protein